MFSNLFPQTKTTLLLQKIILGITGVLVLYTGFLWLNYSNDKIFAQQILECDQTSGSHSEYNECIKVPTRMHQARGNRVRLFTTYSLLVPILGFLSIYSYSFFFFKKRD